MHITRVFLDGKGKVGTQKRHISAKDIAVVFHISLDKPGSMCYPMENPSYL